MRSVGRRLRTGLRSVGQRLLAHVVALVGAVNVVPLPGHPDVGTILVVAAVVGLALLPKSGVRRGKVRRGGRGRAEPLSLRQGRAKPG